MMRKILKMFKAIWKWLSTIVAAACILCTIVFGYIAIAKVAGNPLPTVFGWGNVVVLSGSMEPEQPVGSLLWIHKQDSYIPGDVVTYEEENGVLVTHRLVSVIGDTAVTKGDANNVEDFPIELKQIRGKVSAVWPGVGRALLLLKSSAGILLLLLCGGLILFLPNRFRKGKKQ